MNLQAIALLHDIADLLLARACVGCEEPGPVLCELCASALMPLPFAVPDLAPELPPTFAGLPYEGLGRTVVISHKERGVSWLTPAIGTLVYAAAQLGGPVDALVPVPSHPRSLRSRGRDTVEELAQHAAGRLGVPVTSPLRRKHGLRQKARSGKDRRSLADHTEMLADGPDGRHRRVILIDDVIATGSTVRVCTTALRDAGWDVAGIAVAAASVLRTRGSSSG